MRTQIPPLISSLFFVAPLLTTPALVAQETESTTLALWTFEEWTEEMDRVQEIGPISPEVGEGTAYGWHADNQTLWRLPVGHGSETALSSNRWSAGDYYEFSVSTTGFHSIQLDWNMTRSSAGPETWLLGYSVDGENFTMHNFMTPDDDTFLLGTSEWRAGSAPAASIYSADLSDVFELENQPNAFFRILAAVDGENANGAVRIDNFSVTATPIPEPSTVTLVAGLAVAVYAGVQVAMKRHSKEKA